MSSLSLPRVTVSPSEPAAPAGPHVVCHGTAWVLINASPESLQFYSISRDEVKVPHFSIAEFKDLAAQQHYVLIDRAFNGRKWWFPTGEVFERVVKMGERYMGDIRLDFLVGAARDRYSICRVCGKTAPANKLATTHYSNRTHKNCWKEICERLGIDDGSVSDRSGRGSWRGGKSRNENNAKKVRKEPKTTPAASFGRRIFSQGVDTEREVKGFLERSFERAQTEVIESLRQTEVKAKDVELGQEVEGVEAHAEFALTSILPSSTLALNSHSEGGFAFLRLELNRAAAIRLCTLFQLGCRFMVEWGRGIFTEATPFTLRDVEGMSEMDPQLTNLLSQQFAYLKTPIPPLPPDSVQPRVRIPMMENAFNFFVAVCSGPSSSASSASLSSTEETAAASLHRAVSVPSIVFRDAEEFRAIAVREMGSLPSPPQTASGYAESEPPLPPLHMTASTDTHSQHSGMEDSQWEQSQTESECSEIRAFQGLCVSANGNRKWRATIGSGPGPEDQVVSAGASSLSPPVVYRNAHRRTLQSQTRSHTIPPPSSAETATTHRSPNWSSGGSSHNASPAPWPYGMNTAESRSVSPHCASWRHMPVVEGESVMRTGGGTSVRDLLRIHEEKGGPGQSRV
uniref:Uncharacterized protein n=1 Tax=Chromera velia CCMP2878 TaxID=1169474 RepID=A0A0G4G2Y7_9ALVE|eukprot:Cvel_19996.t1-p1 / transcript=Cvel_19996.t1 / gene=Cvel_19996 / organism=Chromera_velia_CCMP2878 / gene_product=hypothetical protein / transcript_product=hypothetical protein / location=Cvel_scaffold1762:18232-20106(-) / protein_length=625 / sequence_SO=supercontig / SO=protein_coding / is_pseudo=false